MNAADALFRNRSVAVAGVGFRRIAERLGLTITGCGLLLLAALGWWTARTVGARAMYLMVYIALVVMVMAWFIARRKLALDVERSELPSRMRAGQHAAVELTARARRRVNTVIVREELPTRLGQGVAIPVTTLRRGEEASFRYTLSPSLRGVYSVGPTVAIWSDPFGLTTHTQKLADAVEVIVHPRIEAARDRVLTRMWEDPPVRPPVSKPWPVGFEFYGMRDYVPGDDLRRVVWSVMAKTGRMMVRESEQGITDRVVVIVDTDAEWHSPGDPSETLETAVEVAAGVGVQHLDDGFSVTLMTNDGILAKALRGGHGHADFVLLDHLARLQASKTPLGKIMFDLFQEARHRPHILLVTPRLGDAEAAQLKMIVERGLSVVVAQIVWDETDPMSASRAAAIGASVVQVEPGTSLSAAFAHQVGAGAR